MAAHWSSQVCVLCWNDPASDGRRRMSWGTREHCERLAHGMTDEHDPVLYGSLGSRITIRPPAPKKEPKKAAHKGRGHRKPRPTPTPAA